MLVLFYTCNWIFCYTCIQTCTKEGFLESINETINSSNRKLKIFKEDMSNVADTGARAVKKLFRS